MEYVPRIDDFLPSSFSFDKNLFKTCRFLKISMHFFFGFSNFFRIIFCLNWKIKIKPSRSNLQAFFDNRKFWINPHFCSVEDHERKAMKWIDIKTHPELRHWGGWTLFEAGVGNLPCQTCQWQVFSSLPGRFSLPCLTCHRNLNGRFLAGFRFLINFVRFWSIFAVKLVLELYFIRLLLFLWQNSRKFENINTQK